MSLTYLLSLSLSSHLLSSLFPCFLPPSLLSIHPSLSFSYLFSLSLAVQGFFLFILLLLNNTCPYLFISLLQGFWDRYSLSSCELRSFCRGRRRYHELMMTGSQKLFLCLSVLPVLVLFTKTIAFSANLNYYLKLSCINTSHTMLHTRSKDIYFYPPKKYSSYYNHNTFYIIL